MTQDYVILRDLITSNTKTLRDLEERIKKALLRGYITADEEGELMTLAAAQAAPPDVPESTEIAIRLGAVEGSLAVLVSRVAALENGGTTGQGEEPGETPAAPPPGVEIYDPTKAYMYGAITWKDGKVWISQEGNNRFTPGVHAWAWKEAAVW